METIKSYLNSLFAHLPDTKQVRDLKEDLMLNMEEKYYELKREGKSENEAIGVVISEFGNIDELIDELGITKTKSITGIQETIPPRPLRNVTEEEAKDYLNDKRKDGARTGIGVVLCISGVAMLILLRTLIHDGILGNGITEDVGNIAGVIAMFLLVASGVAIFIFTHSKMEQYEYLERPFHLPEYIRMAIQQQYSAFSRTYTISLIAGVSLCILAPIVLFVTSLMEDNGRMYGAAILLMLIAIAVYIFIYYGSIRESMAVLLQIDEYSVESKESRDDKVIGAVAVVVWPLAVCIFLVSGLVYHQWHINWIIFPITGILFGMFCGVYNIIKGTPKS